MKTILIALLYITATLLLIGCSTPMYQVSQVTSRTVKENNSFLVYENDSIKVVYNYWSSGGRFTFVIFNKLNNPIFWDLTMSSLIHNGRANSYYDSKINFNSTSLSVTSKNKNLEVSQSTSNTVGMQQNPYIFLPPNSRTDFSYYSLVENIFTVSRDSLFNYSTAGKPFSLHFNQENSPLIFRNYLTFWVNRIKEKILIVDNDFYINNVKFLNGNLFETSGYDSRGYYYKKHNFKSPNKFYNYFEFRYSTFR